MKTFTEISNEINKKQEEIRNLENTLDNTFGSEFIRLAYEHIDGSDLFDKKSFADYLAEELLERDYPMVFSDIESIFIFSGQPFEHKHIMAAKPESVESYQEEAVYYGEV